VTAPSVHCTLPALSNPLGPACLVGTNQACQVALCHHGNGCRHGNCKLILGASLVASTQVPGYTLMAGKGLFTAGRFNCSGTLRSGSCLTRVAPVCHEQLHCW